MCRLKSTLLLVQSKYRLLLSYALPVAFPLVPLPQSVISQSSIMERSTASCAVYSSATNIPGSDAAMM